LLTFLNSISGVDADGGIIG
jgi:hypothetical protein